MRRFLVPEADGPVEPSAPPSFSVLIRTYQNADTVVEAVESALNQTLPPFEIVVYDDGSTDGTDDVLRLYGDRIRYFRRENAGAAEAFNRGLEAARGDFVVVLDADDAFEPERIEALSELATARPDLDIVTTDAAWESEGRVVGRFNSEANPFEVENQRAAILERCFIVAPGVRRSAVLGVGGQDTRPRGLRGLGLLDPDDPRRIEGRIRRRAALGLPPARGKRQLRTAQIVPAPCRHARTSPDE